TKLEETSMPFARRYLPPKPFEALKMMRDFSKEVAEITDEHGSLLDFLDDADKLADAEEDVKRRDRMKERLMRLREAAFRMEDVIDEYCIRVKEKQPQHGPRWAASLSKTVHSIKTFILRLQIACKIQDEKSVVRDEKVGFESQYFSEKILNSSRENKNVTFNQLRMDPLFMKEEEVVGLAGPTERLTDWLTNGREERTVISVVGIAGVGKTTLAKHVFDKVHDDFECHALITVSQSYTVEELLRKMVRKLCKERKEDPPCKISTMDRGSLIEEVRDRLHQKRYVVLFDDVWNEKFWDDIQSALIDDNNKSRIIMTTRHEKVAIFCKKSSFVEVHKLEEPLKDESFRLFCRKAFKYGSAGGCPEELKDISLEIVRKCKGLPLAMVAIGGFLSQKDESAKEWRLFSQNLSSELKRNPDLNIITKIIGLSYDNLPSPLRLCLLYFGMYPKDYEIESERLVRQWVAEGFVTHEDGKTLEEVAHEYLLGLVRRSLVQVSSFSMEGKVKKCCVHDLIHDMIRTKVKDTCFGEYIGGGHDQSESSELVRRLTIQANNDLNRRIKRSHIRSIIVIPGKKEELLSVHLVRKIPTDYMLLKVLDFEGCGLLCVPKKLENLIYLRYLSFRGTQIKVLPKSIGKLVNLETLDIQQTQVCKVPKEITKLRKLRHLLTPDSVSSSIEWKDIGGMTMLQKIPQVRMEDDGVAIREVGKLKQLRNLRVLCFSGEHITLLFSSINEMEHLQALRIEKSGDRSVVDLNTTSPMFPRSRLRKLFLDIKLEKLPNWIPQLHDLERLILRHSDLTNDPLESLKDMPSLLVLSLSHAYEGQTLHFKSGGFKKLRKLNLEHLWNLNSILIDETALQSLEHLNLKGLDELRTVPDGIQHLKKLKFLLVPSMPTQFVKEIDRIGKNQHWDINYGYM
ncbi:disease resistance protein RPM1, partial [Vigna radiata var. radiata]|uniref:Disease resistance protein RPM1 n=1 Tax=Vigna radiata var. radiata TaxID=3916 RepID=A0A1S3VFX5_VIGRR